MLRKIKTILTIVIMLSAIAGGTSADAAVKGWESVKTERADAKTVIHETELEIKTASGVIIVNTDHAVQIRIFTILGRLVSSETVSAGRSQFQLPAHGVYIVKVGDLTCKVAV